MTPIEQAREALQDPLSRGPTWALIERYADAVCEYNTAVRIDVGIDKAGAACLAVEKELRAHLAALSAQEVPQAVASSQLHSLRCRACDRPAEQHVVGGVPMYPAKCRCGSNEFNALLATAPAAPKQAQMLMRADGSPSGVVLSAQKAAQPVAESVPWPKVVAYPGGASAEGLGAWVDVQLSDGPEITRFVRVAAQPVAQEPDGRLHADGYFTWKRRDGYVLDQQLPCDFYLAPTAAPVAQPVPQALSEEQIDAAIAAWFEQAPTPKEAGPQFRRRMRLAFAAAGINGTGGA